MASYNDTSNIMNVREIIDTAFGDLEGNAVNFRLLQTILYLLARQLRLLERRVEVEFGPLTLMPSGTTLSVTEVKIHAMQKKKRKTKDEGDKGAGGAKASIGSAKTSKGGKSQFSSEKSSSDKTSSDKTSTDKTSSDKTSTDKTSSDKTSSDKTSSDKTSTDKTSSDKTSSDKTSTDKTSSDKTSTDKTSSDKTSTDRTTSSKSTSSSKDKSKPSTDKTSLMEDSSGKASKRGGSDKSSSKRGPTDVGAQRKLHTYPDDLATLEEQKERELRIIHQRKDSFEEAATSPTPMASIDSLEAQHEKILVVQRRPSTESRRSDTLQAQGRSPQISVVTQQQFEQVAQAVRELQSHLLPVGTPSFPERAELMQELKRGASLTDAMAALQLSARLEATEKALEHMIAMVTEIAKQTPGIELHDQTMAVSEVSSAVGTRGTTKESKSPRMADHPGASGAGGGVATSRSVVAHSPGTGSRTGSAKSTKKSGETDRKFDERQAAAQPKSTIPVEPSETTALLSQTTTTANIKSTDESMTPEDELAIKSDYITYQELREAAKEIYDNLMSTVTDINARTSNNAEQAYKISLKLEGKMKSALAVSSRMIELEDLISQYAEQINTLDTGLSSQMTNYQEQLMAMQHDLETGLETMAEVLGNTGGDTVAVAELNSHFTSLQLDFDNMLYRQKALKDAQDFISSDLESLWKQIEMLRDTKSDREEVVDALRDKAGIGELNGLVSLEQFDAVRGDFEKRIGSAYDKFNNQEILWQREIDDLVRELNEKADIIQVECLRNEINKYLNIMKSRIQMLIDIVGEPKSAMLSKKLFRNSACLSCGSPAHMDMEEPVLVPALPKLHTSKQPEGAEAESKLKGDGDHTICYPGLPLPHSRDPRSHVCQRYCGGSHTVLTEGPSRVPPAMVISQPLKEITTELGTDGKMYLVDPQTEKIPCLACNTQEAVTTPTPQSKQDPIPNTGNNIVATDAQSTEPQVQDKDMMETVSVTPPALGDEASI